MTDVVTLLSRKREIFETYPDANGRNFSTYRSEPINPDGLTAIKEIERLRDLNDKLLKAVKLFVHYDSAEGEEDIGMMLNYADAIEASHEALKEYEKKNELE
jgi:hypothetical protein